MNSHLPKVRYDKSLRLLTVRPGIWKAALSLLWFDNFKVITVFDVPIAPGRLLNINHFATKSERVGRLVKDIYSSKAFARMVQREQLQDYVHIVNHKTAKHVQGYAMLGGIDEIAARYENKVNIRKFFEGRLPFPKYRILQLGMLAEHDTYARLCHELGVDDFVVQTGSGGGGRGTFFVSDVQEMAQVVALLSESLSPSDSIVVSARIAHPQERSLQACIAQGRIHIGVPQAQLIRHKDLVSEGKGVQFCGGRIEAGLVSATQYQKAKEIVRAIGTMMMREGYKGVFGVDFLVDETGELYVLEVNARLTGITPLLSSLQVDAPFMLLHILELADSQYEIADLDQLTIRESGSFIILYAKQMGSYNFLSGIYNDKMQPIGPPLETGSLLPENSTDVFVGMRVGPGEVVERGKAIAYIYATSQLFDDTEQLSDQAYKAIRAIQDTFSNRVLINVDKNVIMY